MADGRKRQQLISQNPQNPHKLRKIRIRMAEDEMADGRKRRHASRCARRVMGRVAVVPRASCLRGSLIFPLAVPHFLFYNWFTFTFYILQVFRITQLLPFNGQSGVISQSFSLIFLVLYQSTPLKWEVKISGPKSHGFERLMLVVQNIKGGLCNGFISNSVQFDRDWVNLMTTGWNTKQNLFQQITQFLTDWDNLMLDREISINENHLVYVHLMPFHAHLNLKMGQALFKETI